MRSEPRKELTEAENSTLSEMGLSYQARKAVAEVWKTGPKPISQEAMKGFYWIIPIGPLMALILGANLLYPSPLLSKLTVLCAAVAWIFQVFLYSFGVACSSLIVLFGIVHPLSAVGMGIRGVKSLKNRLWKLYSYVLDVSLVVLLALNGYGITSSAIVLVWIAGAILIAVARDKVNEAVQEAESKPAV